MPTKGGRGKKGGEGENNEMENIKKLMNTPMGQAATGLTSMITGNTPSSQDGGKKKGRKTTTPQKGAVNIAPFVSALALLGTRIANDHRFINRKNKVNVFGDTFKTKPKSRSKKGGMGQDLYTEEAPVVEPKMEQPLAGTGAGKAVDMAVDALTGATTGGRRKRTPRSPRSPSSPRKAAGRTGRSKSPAKSGNRKRSKSPAKRGKAAKAKK